MPKSQKLLKLEAPFDILVQRRSLSGGPFILTTKQRPQSSLFWPFLWKVFFKRTFFWDICQIDNLILCLRRRRRKSKLSKTTNYRSQCIYTNFLMMSYNKRDFCSLDIFALKQKQLSPYSSDVNCTKTTCETFFFTYFETGQEMPFWKACY